MVLDRSETDIINVAEQRIWQSMKEGEFENLPGKGKPLDLSTNPHVDPAEDTLFRVLAKNGCAPEWVELNKEIRTQVNVWRLGLKKAWANRCDQSDSQWIESCKALKLQMSDINNKVSHSILHFVNRDLVISVQIIHGRSNGGYKLQVFRYNLIVPFGRQMFGLKWEKELASLEDK